MVYITDDSAPVSIQVGGMYENFDNHEHGPSGDTYLAPDGTLVSIVDMPRNATSYLRKPGAQGLTTFDLSYKLKITRLDNAGDGGGTGSGFMVPIFTHLSSITNYNQANSAHDGFGIMIRTWHDASIIRIINMQCGWNQPGNNAHEIYFLSGFLNHDFYIRFWREIVGGTSPLHLGIYDDPAFSILSTLVPSTFNPDTFELLKTDLTPDITTYDYFLPVTGRALSVLPYYVAGVLSDLTI